MAATKQPPKRPTSGKTTSTSSTRKTGTTTKKPSSRTTAAQKREQEQKQRTRQIGAILMGVFSLLWFALIVYAGEKAWLWIHEMLLGMFGLGAVVIPILLCYGAVRISVEPTRSIGRYLLQLAALMLFFCSAVELLFSGGYAEGDLNAVFNQSFELGKAWRGGGIYSLVLGYLLWTIFGQVGASIILILALFFMALVLSGKTLMEFFALVKKPFTAMAESYADKREGIDIINELEAQGTPKKQKASTDDLPTYPMAGQQATVRPELDFQNERELPKGESVLDHFFGIKKETGQQAFVEAVPDPEKHLDPVPPIERAMPTVHEEVPMPIETPPVDPMPQAEEIPLPTAQTGATPPAEKPTTKTQLDALISRATGGASHKQAVETILATGVTGDLPTEEPKLTKAQSKADVTAKAVEMSQQIQSAEAEKVVMAYRYPQTTMLKARPPKTNTDSSAELRQNAELLVDTLKSFGVQTRVINISCGPTVTRYELQPSAGVKISKITGLADDIALNLATAGVRIEAPIPNKAAVGIEVPNKNNDIVTIREMLESTAFQQSKSKVSVALGKDISGQDVVFDIAKMPHMLIAGATGSGKSVCINALIMSILYKATPDEVRLLMVDPKVVELGVYNGIPHLLVPVVTDPRKAAGALGWAVTEMLNRYKLFAANQVRDLTGFNKLAKTNEELTPMPQIVIIIDELADLMMAAPNEVEDAICRLAQMARAAGMHLVIATQRPSVDVITGVIKANIPSRIAFSVSSQVDSRTIIDSGGAEKLLGRGDMLFYPVGMPKPTRLQCCFVSDKEVETVVNFIKNEGEVVYDDQIMSEIERQAVQEKKGKQADDGGGFDEEDAMLGQAIEVVVETGQASTSFLQRKLKVGYARAARLMDDMEAKGIIGPSEGSKPRQVLMTRQQWIEMRMAQSDEGTENVPSVSQSDLTLAE